MHVESHAAELYGIACEARGQQNDNWDVVKGRCLWGRESRRDNSGSACRRRIDIRAGADGANYWIFEQRIERLRTRQTRVRGNSGLIRIQMKPPREMLLLSEARGNR